MDLDRYALGGCAHLMTSSGGDSMQSIAFSRSDSSKVLLPTQLAISFATFLTSSGNRWHLSFHFFYLLFVPAQLFNIGSDRGL